jgi:acyl-homoserine lactone acylase PvdQ
MRLRVAMGALRFSTYLQFLAPRPPAENTISLQERLESFPTKGTPVERRVEIRWNQHQVPFIEAQTGRDLAVALGLVHAHLRLGQMEILRRLAFGRVSEMIGPAGLDIDHALRIFDLGACPLYGGGAGRQVASWPVDPKGRNGWSQASAGLASRAMHRRADRLRP